MASKSEVIQRYHREDLIRHYNERIERYMWQRHADFLGPPEEYKEFDDYDPDIHIGGMVL